MDLYAHFNNLLGQIPPEVQSSLIEILVQALVASPVAIAIKKWFSVDSDKKMLTIVTALSFVSAAVAYLVTTPQFAPQFIILSGWLTLASTQPLYRFLFKPLFNRVGLWFSRKVAEATMISEARAAAVPSDGLSIQGR